MIGIPRCFTAGHASAQYFVQAARRSSSPSLSIVDVIEGCKETTRLGVKSPSWERTGITCSGIYNYRMPLSINDPQAEALVKQLTEKTSETPVFASWTCSSIEREWRQFPLLRSRRN